MQDRIFVDTDCRTFETRLQFIKEIFSNKYKNHEILAKCIEHKLKISYEQYLENLKNSWGILATKDPIKVLKRIK